MPFQYITKHKTISILLLLTLFTYCFSNLVLADEASDQIYGPINLLKTLKTPFKASQQEENNTNENIISPLSLPIQQKKYQSGLSARLIPSRLYLPSKLIIGQSQEFVISGKANSWVALAMADRDTGAKAIYGHTIRLGPDRKVVAVGQIPTNGVLSLSVETPIQGDLIGQCLYFEAALWTKDDFSDMELAHPVQSEKQPAISNNESTNGVIVSAEIEKKRGIRFTTDSAVPLMQRERLEFNSLSTGRP
jgi:hypothetical protein